MSCLENLPRETKIYSWVNLYSHQSQMRIPEQRGATWRSASWLSGEGKTIFCADLAWSRVFFVAVLKDRRFKWKDFGTEVLLGIIWLKTLCFPHTRHVMVAHGSQGASGCPSRGTSPCHSSLPEEWDSESPGGLAKIHVAGLQPQSLTQIWVALKMFISEKFPCDAAVAGLVQSPHVGLCLP